MGLYGFGFFCLVGRRRYESELSGKAGVVDEVTWLLKGGRCVRFVCLRIRKGTVWDVVTRYIGYFGFVFGEG